MAIEQVKNSENKLVYKYKTPSIEEIFDKYCLISDVFKKYLQCHGLTEDDIIVNKQMFGKIIDRVNKRKDYFIIFHDETYINEIKEISLYAYWIIKMSPFTVRYDETSLERSRLRINEGFAAFLILSVAKASCKRAKRRQLNISKEYSVKLMYALKYWDLSKEAIILIAESLVE